MQEFVDAETAVSQAITNLNRTVNISLPFHISDQVRCSSILQTSVYFILTIMTTLASFAGFDFDHCSVHLCRAAGRAGGQNAD